MKSISNVLLVGLVSICLTTTSCFQSKRTFDGVFTPNCKVFSIGSICFHNPDNKAAKVEIDGIKMEVLPFSTRCFDMYEGDYEYKVKNDDGKWEEEVAVIRCKEEKVELKRCSDC